MEEVELAVGRDEQQPVGLRDGARDLREELRPGDADRDRQADALAHRTSQALCDLDRLPGDPAHAAHIEERLVDRQPLDERRDVVEDAVRRLARRGVRLHPRRHDDRVRAEAPRPTERHRRLHAEGLGLVTRREDDAGADDHRQPAQARVVALLDRRVERVQICVEDRRLHTNVCSHIRTGPNDRVRPEVAVREEIGGAARQLELPVAVAGRWESKLERP